MLRAMYITRSIGRLVNSNRILRIGTQHLSIVSYDDILLEDRRVREREETQIADFQEGIV